MDDFLARPGDNVALIRRVQEGKWRGAYSASSASRGWNALELDLALDRQYPVGS